MKVAFDQKELIENVEDEFDERRKYVSIVIIAKRMKGFCANSTWLFSQKYFANYKVKNRKKESVMNIDWWKACDWLVDLWYEKHYRVHHGKMNLLEEKNISME